MKRIYITLLLIIVATAIFAQSPQAFKYQAIARDEVGNILSMRDISLRVSFIQEGDDGQAVYIETHKVRSNIYGLINFIVGEGDVLNGEFGSIKWGQSRHYIKIEMDIDGGEDYKDLGTSQLYAVPYALFAEQAGSVVRSNSGSGSSSSSSSGSGSRNGGANSKFPADTSSFLNVNFGNVGVGTTDPQEKLDVHGKIMSTLGYNTNGDDGLSDTLNIVSDISFDNLKLKYRTLAFSGGILTYMSDTSEWVDTVGMDILSFSCGDSLLDERDGQRYGTVLIGNQCWLSENMNYETGSSYCHSNPANCAVYGRLYDWASAMLACPSGWHLPSDDEWKILEGTVDSNIPVGDSEWDEDGWRGFNAGHHLKSTSGWNNAENGDDSYGFTALPGGNRSAYGDYFNLTYAAYFWTSTEIYTDWARFRKLSYDENKVYRGSTYQTHYHSARCLKDD